MNEQERIAAIDALCNIAMENLKEKGNTVIDSKDNAMASIINSMRILYEGGLLGGKHVCICLLHKVWRKASSEEMAICENAVQAMREVIEDEQMTNEGAKE